MSVIARTASVGRERARVVGDADPYGCPWGWRLPAVAVSVSINKTQPLQCFPHCGGWVV